MTVTSEPPIASTTLAGVVAERADTHAHKQVFAFLPDGEREEATMTYGELHAAARQVAAFVDDAVPLGTAVPLLYAPGLEFVTAFIGLAMSRAVAVPLYPPVERTGAAAALGPVFDQLDPPLVLTGAGFGDLMRAAFASGLPRLRAAIAETTPDGGCTGDAVHRRVAGDLNDQTAYLQFTSGSTGNPKGVVVGQRGLLHNLALIHERFAVTENSVGAHWLPPYHDMGLVGALLTTIYGAAFSVLMPPAAFVQQPIRWLRAISRYHGTIAGGPDFAYRLLVAKTTPADREGLDLRSWSVAFDGAERVRAETLEDFARVYEPHGFDAQALYPCYGLAEATLYVSGRRGLRSRKVAGRTVPTASCGAVSDVDGRLVIVDPDTRREMPDGGIGEIWLASPSLALGYRSADAVGTVAFTAHIDGGDGTVFARTGDLGTVVDGELYLVGRSKDVLIVRGRNYAAEDVERSAEAAHAALRPGRVAAVADDEDTLVIVAELRDAAIPREVAADVAAAIRAAVTRGHDIAAERVLLVSRGTVPTTPSGKLRRSSLREAVRTDTLDALHVSALDPATRPVIGLPDLARDDSSAILDWLLGYVASLTGRSPLDVRPDSSIDDAALDSLAVAELCAALSDLIGAELSVAGVRAPHEPKSPTILIPTPPRPQVARRPHPRAANADRRDRAAHPRAARTAPDIGTARRRSVGARRYRRGLDHRRTAGSQRAARSAHAA